MPARKLSSALVCLLSAGSTFAQNAKRDWNDVRFEFDRRPIMRFGDWFRAEFRGRVQTDFRVLSPDYETGAGLFEIRRARVGVEGVALRHFEYEVESSLNDEFSEGWRDVFVNVRTFRRAQLQGGKFKIPFGREQLTSASRLDFIYRSRISDQFAPARNVGAMLHGRFLQRGLLYYVGWFRADGENAYIGGQRTGERAWAARITATPLRALPVPRPLRNLEIGIAGVTSNVPEGLHSLRIRSAGRETIMPEMYVKGRRNRLGTEFEWLSGPFSVKSEFMHVQMQRLNQSIFETNLPDLIGRGWYTSATWLVTGEQKADRIEAKRALFRGGAGAVELGSRYEQIRFGTPSATGTPLRNPRATNVRAQSDRVWTHGVNWFLNDWSRIQFNAVHETIEDAQRAIITGRTRYWTWVTRLQFSM